MGKLSNGLRVILSKDNAVPVVTVYMIYDVGSRAEEKGHTGFAHLFEHMMFEGSKNVPKGPHFAAVESNGGTLNGSTHPDFTDYFEVLPSNKLATALWLESDRMRSLAINDAKPKQLEISVNPGAALKLRQPTLRHGHCGCLAHRDVPQLAKLALAHRLIRRPERLQRRGRLEVLQDLLRAQQRGAGDCRRY